MEVLLEVVVMLVATVVVTSSDAVELVEVASQGLEPRAPIHL